MVKVVNGFLEVEHECEFCGENWRTRFYYHAFSRENEARILHVCPCGRKWKIVVDVGYLHAH
jgi:hypothetical protein